VVSISSSLLIWSVSIVAGKRESDFGAENAIAGFVVQMRSRAK
jgi:hypothetical protein